MSELLPVCFLIAVVCLIVVLLPFYRGAGGQLLDASVNDNPDVLERRKEALLRRWIQDELAAKRGELSDREWAQRQRYLTSRYVDAAKRLAWLRSTGLLTLLTVFLAGSVAQPARAQTAAAPRQMWVLKPGQDRVFGTWVAAVMNKGAKAETFRLPVLLPQNVSDFQAGEGVVQADIKLESDGLWIERSFEPGVNVVSFTFMVPASFGRVAIEAAARSDVGELSVMTPAGMMEVTSELFKKGQSETMDGKTKYDVFVPERFLLKGDQWKIMVSGVPEGRFLLWLTGGGVALLLVLCSALLAFKTRPDEAFAQ